MSELVVEERERHKLTNDKALEKKLNGKVKIER